jgi:alkylated DNA repair dioxygenase AlkB
MKRTKFSKIHHELSEDSWMDVYPDHVESDSTEIRDLWSLCPTVRDKVKIFGKEIPIPRFQRLYGDRDYRYSGITMIADKDIPTIVERCIEIARERAPEFQWNGALVNWYHDGSSYVGAHSDDEKDLVRGSPIFSFSFGSSRIFRVKSKPGMDVAVKAVDVDTGHGMLIVMGGKMQTEFKHEIVKTRKPTGRRINITVRSFNE